MSSGLATPESVKEQRRAIVGGECVVNFTADSMDDYFLSQDKSELISPSKKVNKPMSGNKQTWHVSVEMGVERIGVPIKACRSFAC